MPKRKERPPTLEELKEKLKAETTSRWLHSAPQFGLLPTANGVQFLPLSEVSETSTTVVFLLDSCDYMMIRVLELLDVWRLRYKNLSWIAAVVIPMKYLFQKNPRFFDQYRLHPSFSELPILLDPFSEMHEKYGSQRESVALVLHRGEMVLSVPLRQDLPANLIAIERALQSCLRRGDEGLPLPLIHEYKIDALVDSKTVTVDETSRTGEWSETPSSVTTNDPAASLSVSFEGNACRVAVALGLQAHDSCRVFVNWDQGSVPSAFYGHHLKSDDRGNTYFEVNRYTGVYEVVKSENPVKGILKFSSVGFMESPVTFYEFRFANFLKR